MELGNILVNMRSEAEECSAFLTSGSGSAEQRLKVLATLSDYSRRQGIAAYLDGLDLERFRSCLKRSAEARLRFLKLRTGSGESCYVDAVDALKPFFDAVVCGELALAVQIAEASPDAGGTIPDCEWSRGNPISGVAARPAGPEQLVVAEDLKSAAGLKQCVRS